MIHPAVLAGWALATALASRWFVRRSTLRLGEWVWALLLAVPVALGLAWLLEWVYGLGRAGGWVLRLAP